MTYFLSHIGYILVAAVVIAVLGFAAVVLGEKNAARRDINDERCDYTCESCPNTQLCHKEGKRDVL